VIAPPALRVSSLSLHRMRGEGRGEGLRASALVTTPLIRPAATFSPPPRKGEGSFRGPSFRSAGFHWELDDFGA
ncbi:MAG: hypothetical protein ABMA26_18800, partial [Limisphaerales bacterium]